MIIDDLYKVVMLHAAWIIIYQYGGLMDWYVTGIAMLAIITYIMIKNVSGLLNDSSKLWEASE